MRIRRTVSSSQPGRRRRSVTVLSGFLVIWLPWLAVALAGLGMTMAPEFSVEKELASGTLVSLLEDRIPSGGGIYAVYPHRRHVPGKVRVFVDFLTLWFKEKRKFDSSLAS